MLDDMLDQGDRSSHKDDRTQLNDKVKPADRVTFLINYMYMAIRNYQLVGDKAREIQIMQEIFIGCTESYINIMAEWVNRGELNDRY